MEATSILRVPEFVDVFLNHIESSMFLRRGGVTDSEETSFPGNVSQDCRGLGQFQISIDKIRKIRELKTKSILDFEPAISEVWILGPT